MLLTRRRVLAALGWLPLAWSCAWLRAQGLSDFTTAAGAPSCNGARTPTPAVPSASYKANAPERTSLRTADVTGVPLRVTGHVIGLRCGVIKDAQVEFWQADATGAYDMAGFRLRGRERTDAAGQFAFDTVMPGAVAGRARQLDLRVTPPGHPALVTAWFFPDDPARTADPAFQPALELKAVPGAGGTKTVSLDVVFDL